jgi:hypothetical protein
MDIVSSNISIYYMIYKWGVHAWVRYKNNVYDVVIYPCLPPDFSLQNLTIPSHLSQIYAGVATHFVDINIFTTTIVNAMWIRNRHVIFCSNYNCIYIHINTSLWKN